MLNADNHSSREFHDSTGVVQPEFEVLVEFGAELPQIGIHSGNKKYMEAYGTPDVFMEVNLIGLIEFPMPNFTSFENPCCRKIIFQKKFLQSGEFHIFSPDTDPVDHMTQP